MIEGILQNGCVLWLSSEVCKQNTYVYTSPTRLVHSFTWFASDLDVDIPDSLKSPIQIQIMPQRFCAVVQ